MLNRATEIESVTAILNGTGKLRCATMSVSKLAATFNALIIIGILALASVSGSAIEVLRIGGQTYTSIVSSKDLVADILPPPLYVIEALQEVTDLRDTPQDFARHSERLATLRRQYLDRKAYWANSTLNADLQRKLTIDSDREAQRFWEEVETTFLPAVQNHNKERALQSFVRIRAAYDAHRSIVDEVVNLANAYTAQVEKTAETRKDLFLLCVIASAIISLYLAMLAIRHIRERVIKPLIELADYMESNSEHPIGSPVPFLERDDEIGVVAHAVAAFRSTVEQRSVETKKAQLDAALSNIVQGVEMYDAEGRLALCNTRLNQIYCLGETLATPGLSLNEMIELRIGAKLLSEEAANTLSLRIDCGLRDPNQSEFYCHLADGRCISIAVRPLSNEGGFVATHQDVTEQRRSDEKVAYFAHHDALTGLPNRVRLNDDLEQALSYAKRGEVVAVHVLDLDNFKSVNDTLGHPIGDKLLKDVSRRLTEQLRDTDTIARLGGDEFAIVERQISKPLDAVTLAERLTKAVAQPYEIDGHCIIIGTSIGIAIGPQDGSTAEEIMRNADLALYRAKADGRGSFCFFEPEMDVQMQERSQLEKELRNALTRSEFELHYQPIVNVETNEICAFEALLRWRHPQRGLVSPADFIPLAEETRLIVPIGEWVLQETCRAAAEWPQHVKIAVNLSAVQFRFGGVVDVVKNALAMANLAPHRLELEITETLLLDGTEATLETLHSLRRLGVGIAMDDFGTGYSSLSYLQSFPFDKIKIDKSFVQGIDDDDKSLNIIRAVTALANGLGIRTTAEGVESSAQLNAVTSEGCSEVQGYLMSRPLLLSQVEQILKPRGKPVGLDNAANAA